jgi:hypothetical protein
MTKTESKKNFVSHVEFEFLVGRFGDAQRQQPVLVLPGGW